ncbi:hypothetical protein [Paenibacillus sp. Leaf72]|uniref:hypothetical protein n=1 Tax=Paenibacillus sp. Leaf72 TaxID=1736234 RepID=UPI0006F45506|nr:hypothetical protein [Paenibacillus sp. Leaf72]KQN96805.1 hypothetical protein ASF12_22290 [Paenibacillus sp. Leaf72]
MSIELKKGLSEMKRSVRWGLVPDVVAHEILKVIERDNLAASIGSYLIEQGCLYLKPLGAGTGSVVFEITEGMILRLGVGILKPVIESEYVNQPICQKQFGLIRVEIYPKLITKDISDSDVTKLTVLLSSMMIQFIDPGTDNIGKDTNGRLKVIDPGAVVRF